MKSKKIVVGVITASLLTLSTATAFGTSVDANSSQDIVVQDARLMSTPIEEVKHSNFNSYTGKVKSIKKSETQKGKKIVVVEGKQGGEAHFIIDENTYFVNDKEIEEGLSITGYYDATRPMIMIYPPQYAVDAVVVGDIEESIKVDLFDGNLVSKDNQLKIKVDKNTEVISQDGTKFQGELKNKNLLVIYDIATKSIPAQAKPIKVVVLDKEPAVDNNDAIEDSSTGDREIIKLLIQIINTLTGK